MVEQEVNGVFESASIVPGEHKMEGFDLLILTINSLGLRILKLRIDNMLRL